MAPAPRFYRLPGRLVSLSPARPGPPFLASLILLAAGAAIKGPFVGDDTMELVNMGLVIIAWLRDGGAFSDIAALFVFPHYVVSCVLLASLYTYTGFSEWGVVAFNCILFALVVQMVFATWDSMLERPAEGISSLQAMAGFAGGLFVLFGLADGFLWSYAVLTETIFLFWVCGFLFFSILALLGSGSHAWFLSCGFALTAVFVRPTGIILPLLFLFAVLLGACASSRSRLAVAAAVALLLPAVACFVVLPGLVLGMDAGARVSWLPGLLRAPLEQSAYFFSQGIVVSHRVELAVEAPLDYADIIGMMCRRLAYYVIPLRFGTHAYSDIHNFANALYVLVTWPLAVVGTRRLLGAGGPGAKVALFLLVTAYCYALLHAATLVSFDWRYQLPAMLPFWVLAGCGFYIALGYRPGGTHRAGRTL